MRRFGRRVLTPTVAGATPADDVGQQSGFPEQRGRIFIIMAGDLWLPTLSDRTAVPALCRFVRERLLPQDRVAFVAFGRATAITTRHAQVAGVVERVDAFQHGLEFPEARSLYRKDDPKVATEFDALFHDEQAEQPWLSTDLSHTLPPSAQAKLRQLLHELNTHKDPGYLNPEPSQNNRLRDLAAVLYSVRAMPGEKHLLWLPAGGTPLPNDESYQLVASLANDARVAIHTIYPHPLNVGGGWESLRVSALETLSEGTGGRVLAFEAVDTFLSNLDTLTRQAYVLGYHPTNAALDGSYRRIEVRVKRPATPSSSPAVGTSPHPAPSVDERGRMSWLCRVSSTTSVEATAGQARGPIIADVRDFFFPAFFPARDVRARPPGSSALSGSSPMWR